MFIFKQLTVLSCLMMTLVACSNPHTIKKEGNLSPIKISNLSSITQLAIAVENCGIDNFAVAFLEEINRKRARNQQCGTHSMPAAPAVRWDNKLAMAAGRHSRDMAAHNQIMHVGSDGSHFSERMMDAGYSAMLGGENVAMGHADIPGVVNGWMNSPNHCVNIMRVPFTDIGAACTRSANTAKYWTFLSATDAHR